MTKEMTKERKEELLKNAIKNRDMVYEWLWDAVLDHDRETIDKCKKLYTFWEKKVAKYQ